MLKSDKKTGLVFFPAFDWAIDPTHPEREERLLYTQDQVMEEGIFDINGITEYKPELINADDIRRTHFCVPDEASVTTESHLISAGGAAAIGRAVMEKEIDNGFALVRPPGHHAMRIVHGGRGFCYINIEAVMVELLRQQYGIKRVVIVDTDCHHGDGTNDIYWHDPDTLFISIHQDGRTLYPGSGFTGELGGPNAKGSNLNIPLPPGTGTEGYLYVIKNSVLPAIEEFKPDIIVNSAGQDNHYTDPLTNMNFSAQGYAELTTLLKPDIAVLEGGYSIEGALPYVNLGIILALAGMDYSNVVEPDYHPERLKQASNVTDHIKRTSDIINNYWKKRHEMREKAGANGTIQERHREIFYDTDNIFERQKERIRICRECAGALEIDSQAMPGSRIMAVHIPLNACHACKETAYDMFEQAKTTKKYSKIFLQDRPKDEYICF
ncbi:Histone deacetylase-like protein (acetoin utilization protein) [Desulfamplus magnetovallimortis]|uniref:Histone deacetylase-like protein (Acetoin utilization protein) n=1 Tax=Desulfamplus magnetovallimortis TaxID=1246637 RepID=A0A1W1HA23_9BACT|nr:histone deacetylase [Desulfamplus magnetovallimortis]SLM29279.1 Histone deacetylase-like protein (acetoin utilization protein) [Desulfamplus magnetovallimortis]